MTLDDLRRKWPHLHFWRGVTGLLYVRRPRSSPPLVSRAVTVEELQAQIEGEARYRAEHWG